MLLEVLEIVVTEEIMDHLVLLLEVLEIMVTEETMEEEEEETGIIIMLSIMAKHLEILNLSGILLSLPVKCASK